MKRFTLIFFITFSGAFFLNAQQFTFFSEEPELFPEEAKLFFQTDRNITRRKTQEVNRLVDNFMTNFNMLVRASKLNLFKCVTMPYAQICDLFQRLKIC